MKEVNIKYLTQCHSHLCVNVCVEVRSWFQVSCFITLQLFQEQKWLCRTGSKFPQSIRLRPCGFQELRLDCQMEQQAPSPAKLYPWPSSLFLNSSPRPRAWELRAHWLARLAAWSVKSGQLPFSTSQELGWLQTCLGGKVQLRHFAQWVTALVYPLRLLKRYWLLCVWLFCLHIYVHCMRSWCSWRPQDARSRLEWQTEVSCHIGLNQN